RRCFWPSAEVNGQGTPLAAALDDDLGLLPRLARRDRGGDVVRSRDLAPVDLGDLVAVLQPRLGGRPAGDDAADDRAGEILRVAVADAEVGALDLAAVLDLRHHELDRGHRDREADTGVGAAAGLDLRVDADHAAVAVEQRAARVA